MVLDHSRIGWQIDLSITILVAFLNQRNVIGKLNGLERVADGSKLPCATEITTLAGEQEST